MDLVSAEGEAVVEQSDHLVTVRLGVAGAGQQIKRVKVPGRISGRKMSRMPVQNSCYSSCLLLTVLRLLLLLLSLLGQQVWREGDVVPLGGTADHSPGLLQTALGDQPAGRLGHQQPQQAGRGSVL